MFLRCRSTQAEYFDRPERTAAEVAAAFRELGRANRLFQFARPFWQVLPGWLGEDRCRRLEFLDLGAGDGALGRELTAWAERRGWVWRFTSLDLCPFALELDGGRRRVAGSVLALPFKDGSFDVVVASQMTHHLESEEEVRRHFAEAWRVSRDAVLLCDLHRNAALYCLVWLGCRATGLSREMREDGLISTRRSFRVPEWRRLAAGAGLAGAEVNLFYGLRLLLRARKGTGKGEDGEREGRGEKGNLQLSAAAE